MRLARTRNRRAFSVLEVVMVLLIVTALSAVAIVSYSKATQRGRVQAAQAQISDIAEQTLSRRALDGGGTLSREQIARVLRDLHGVTVSDSTTGEVGDPAGWSLLAGDEVPTSPQQMSVAFADGAAFGTRFVLASVTDDQHLVAALVDVSGGHQSLAGAVSTCTSATATSAADVLGGSGASAVCPQP